MWGTSLFGLLAFLSKSFFVAFFVYSLPLPKWRICWMTPYIISLWVLCCVMISWVNGRKYENLLQFNTSWLASLRTWYYLKLYFNCNCSGYDLTLIKNCHTVNCYLFLQKFLLKAKSYKLVVGNCGSSIYC